MTPQASDPDVGDYNRLNYSIVGDTRYFDVQPSSGLVYVVSVADLAGANRTVVVKVTDPDGLVAATTLEVSFKRNTLGKSKSPCSGFYDLKIVF